MAKKIVREIVIDAQTKEAIKNMDKLGKTFEEVFETSNQGLKPLTTQIGELEDAMYALAASGEANSQEFKDLQKKVGDYKKVIIETDLQIDAMAETTAQNLGGAIEGVSGAFAIGTGVMGAFGVESGAVAETLLRVQSAMAISQGLQSVRTGIKNFQGLAASIKESTIAQQLFNLAVGGGTQAVKLLRVALVSVGIGAIVAGVAALVSMFNSWRESINETAATQKMLNGVMQEAMKNTAKEKASLDTLLTAARNENLSRQERLKAVQKLNELSPEYLGNIRLETINSNESIKAIENYVKALNKKAMAQAVANQKAELFEKQLENQTKALGEFIKEDVTSMALTGELQRAKLKGLNLEDFLRDKAIEKRNKENETINNQIKALDELTTKKLESGELDVGDFEVQAPTTGSATTKDAKEEVDNTLAVERQIEDARRKFRKQTRASERSDAKLTHKRFLEDLALDESLSDEQRLALKKVANENLQIELQQINNKYDEISHQKKLEELEADKQFNLEQVAAKKEALDQEVRDREEAEAKKQAAIQEGADMAKTGLQAIGDISNMVADQQMAKAGNDEKKKEQIRKKAFNRNKAIQLSLAAIDGFKAITTSLAQSPIALGPVPNPAGIASLAFAALTTGINIAKIAATKYKGSAQKPTVPNATGGATAAAPAPQFNVVGASTENQLAQTLGAQQQEPVKAFVVAGDVTTAQSLERDKIELTGL
jgi:hypothetical protein